MPDIDVIDTLVGIAPGSKLDAIRARRVEARGQAQASYDALFAPESLGGVPAQERFAVATFLAGLHAQPDVAAFYRGKLGAAGATPMLLAAIDAAVSSAKGSGPYGHYPAGPLNVEDIDGPSWNAAGDLGAALGARLAAAFAHTHMLVFHPRDASPAHLQALLDAGWTTTDIVTLSQLVAFLSFQIRVVAGLRVLAASA
jgi:CMD domain protein